MHNALWFDIPLFLCNCYDVSFAKTYFPLYTSPLKRLTRFKITLDKKQFNKKPLFSPSLFLLNYLSLMQDLDKFLFIHFTHCKNSFILHCFIINPPRPSFKKCFKTNAFHSVGRNNACETIVFAKGVLTGALPNKQLTWSVLPITYLPPKNVTNSRCFCQIRLFA